MANMDPKKHEMPSQTPEVRRGNFFEVALGYDDETARSEAARCLSCKNPKCVEGCPVKIDIPSFVKLTADGDFDGAYDVISRSSSLPAVCGRVCPQESQCESRCVRGIKGEPVGIGRLERFVADRKRESGASEICGTEPNGHRVAIAGSGPAGLTCAGDLARLGYDVTVFEALHTPGGVLVYGIPEFRLPKSIVASEIDNLRALGVKFETNTVIGRTLSVDDLMDDGYEAVFIGTGAGLPRFLGVPGECLNGVYSANEFLTRANLMKAYRDDADTPIMRAERVAVVGGGNVAMDAARCALRLGAEKVYIVYRRSENELPARAEEVEHAKEEGVDFRLLSNPVEILSNEDGFVSGIRCAMMELGEPDAGGRRRPIPVDGQEFILDVDAVIVAVGTSPNPLIKSTTAELSVGRRGEITVDEGGATTRAGVFAGGDAVTGAATVILAMGAGKTAAASIDQYIKNKK